jgi:SAM-dependent methyltransferase
MKLDKEFWSKRYQEDQTGWDIGFCSTPLQEYFDQLTNRQLHILIPGAGYAHEANYLHQLGFTNVQVIDLAQEPLTHLVDICPDFPKENLLLGDFFEHQGQYDLIVEQTFFCAIDPSLREAYVKKMKSLLKSTGKLVGVLFNRDFEGGPPFGGCAEDYRTLFSQYFNSVSIELCYNSIEQRQGSEVFIQVA